MTFTLISSSLAAFTSATPGRLWASPPSFRVDPCYTNIQATWKVVASTAVTATAMQDYSQVASGFFTSIRIPAALIAGSALATMFSNTDFSTYFDSTPSNHHPNNRRMENRILVVYHILALLSFILSLNVIFTATSTSNVLLLGMKNPMAESAYDLLRREVNFEFTSTRWSFFMALFSFLAAVTGRALVEFRILRMKRWLSAGLVVSAMSSLGLHFLSVANRSLHTTKGWPHLGVMTLDLIRLTYKQTRTYPMDAASAVCGILAVAFGIKAFVQTNALADLYLLHAIQEDGAGSDTATEGDGEGNGDAQVLILDQTDS